MKRMLLMMMVAAGLFVQAAVTISDVNVMPLSPSGLVATYRVSGVLPTRSEDFELCMVLRDQDTGEWSECLEIRGDTGLTLGEHRVSWCASEEGVSIALTNCVSEITYTDEKYCVVNLEEGPLALNYRVSYRHTIPGGVWPDECKTTRLVLKRILPGSFIMGVDQSATSHRVVVSKPYYMGVFEVTQKQWELVMGTRPSYYSGDDYPVEQVSYDMIRGGSAGSGWPASADVDSSSFLGKLRKRTGIAGFDLPTEVEWEYACRAGTTTRYSFGESLDGDYVRYYSNCDTSSRIVGSRLANPWGLYDMHGNVEEWCRDWYAGVLDYGEDPSGPSAGYKDSRVYRGGCWLSEGGGCTSSNRDYSDHSHCSSTIGFRACLDFK